MALPCWETDISLRRCVRLVDAVKCSLAKTQAFCVLLVADPLSAGPLTKIDISFFCSAQSRGAGGNSRRRSSCTGGASQAGQHSHATETAEERERGGRGGRGEGRGRGRGYLNASRWMEDPCMARLGEQGSGLALSVGHKGSLLRCLEDEVGLGVSHCSSVCPCALSKLRLALQNPEQERERERE